MQELPSLVEIPERCVAQFEYSFSDFRCWNQSLISPGVKPELVKEEHLIRTPTFDLAPRSFGMLGRQAVEEPDEPEQMFIDLIQITFPGSVLRNECLYEIP